MSDVFEPYRDRRAMFGREVAAYEAGRPPYPEELFELLRQRAGLQPGVELLEIGPGTGLATGELLDHGAHITAVELDPVLAHRLTAAHEGRPLRVVLGAFEDADLEPASVDLVAAATSFHWVLPVDAGLRRCGTVLRPRGCLALFWNVLADPERPDPFHDALQPLLEPIAPSVLHPPGAGDPATGSLPYPLDVPARVGEIDRSGVFGTVHVEQIRWTTRHTAVQLRQLFASFSPWLALPIEQRTRALDALEDLAVHEFGGVVERPAVTVVYLARRR